MIRLYLVLLVLAIPVMVVVGKIIRAGTAHLDQPLPPESLRDGPWGRPRI